MRFPVAAKDVKGGITESGDWRSLVTELLEGNREAIEEACRRHGVSRLHAFGSALREDYSPGESDVDLLVEFKPMGSYERVDAYFGLLEQLRAIFGGEVDLVVSGAVKNQYIARNIEQTKQVLYAA